MYFTKRQKGTVSVFLTLVLVPVMIFGCLTVDASKIYSSKVVISDAGEMSMNAALAQYEDRLFDQYGLLAMEKSPENMQSDLESYFVKSLNSNGISGVSGYEEMLGLIKESFEAFNPDNTEIYRTEVEKQQILEYMKYRAPVCLTELVFEKFGFIKDSKKLQNAMNKEMDFAEAMEDCQDAFEDALKELETLNSVIESFPEPQEIDDELGATQIDFTGTVAKCLLMRAAIQDYTDEPIDRTLKETIESYITAAKGVDLSDPYSEASYESYLSAMYYENGIAAAGGVNTLNGTEEGPDQETDPEGYLEWETKAELITEYNQEKDRISGYMTTLLGCANNYVETHYENLFDYYKKAGEAAAQAQKAWNKLDYVREKLLQASNAYSDWDHATSEMSDEVAGDMKNQVEEYRDFFGEEDLQTLGQLQTKISIDKDYFNEIKSVLEEEKLFDVKIAVTASSSQVNSYSSKARMLVSGQNKSYEELNTIRQESFASHYGHTQVETTNIMYRIHDDPFYLKLKEYCETHESEESDANANKANQNLDAGARGAKDAESDAGYPTYDWSSATQSLPSVKLGLANFSQKASTALTDLDDGNNVKSKSARRGLISKMKNSINEAGSFLDGVDRIVEDNLENLYIAEYAMQMFSYYTCDKKMLADKTLKSLSEEENVSLSGYKLSEDKAYKSEVEYILWGNKASQVNIQSTVALLFGIRLLFNSIYVFTSIMVDRVTAPAASSIAAGAPFLIPIVNIAIKLGLAVAETATDVSKLKQGYGVAILKRDADRNFETLSLFPGADVRNGVTFDYGEYLRIFLNVQMIAGGEEKFLARVGDCIQVNVDTDITKDYTMVELQADVGVRTTFMRRIADWASGDWDYGDSYTVKYKSILGY